MKQKHWQDGLSHKEEIYQFRVFFMFVPCISNIKIPLLKSN